jgi:hypothetical protein
MKKNQFEKQLIAYSLAATAILIKPSLLSADIIYTPTNVVLDSNGEIFDINLDNTGPQEFRIAAHSSLRTTSNGLHRGVALAAWYASGFGTPSFRGTTATWPNALNFGEEIKATPYYWAYRWGTSSWNLAVHVSGGGTGWINGKPFLNTTNKYLGLSFLISGNKHYGWCQVNVNSNASITEITGYAYNDEPDDNIFAGQVVPEVGSLAILALGAAGLSAWRKSRKTFLSK